MRYDRSRVHCGRSVHGNGNSHGSFGYSLGMGMAMGIVLIGMGILYRRKIKFPPAV